MSRVLEVVHLGPSFPLLPWLLFRKPTLNRHETFKLLHVWDLFQSDWRVRRGMSG